MLEDYDDQELIVLSQQGNKQAFGTIVKRYMKRSYFIALGFVHSHDDALDLSQEAFARAFRAIKKFESDKKFFTWYYKILQNLCYNFLRDRRKQFYHFSEISRDDVLQLTESESMKPDRQLEQKELAKCVWEAIHELSQYEKEVIVLREFQEMSYQEMADLLECPVGTVMSRLYHARKHLANALKDAR